jgi:hypothetical protein
MNHYVRNFSLLLDEWYDSYWLPLWVACLTYAFEAMFVRLPAAWLYGLIVTAPPYGWHAALATVLYFENRGKFASSEYLKIALPAVLLALSGGILNPVIAWLVSRVRRNRNSWNAVTGEVLVRPVMRAGTWTGFPLDQRITVLCVLGRWRRRRNNISRHSTSESNCLEYHQHQFLLRGCEVFAPKTEPIRATDIAEIYARDSVARCSWTNYSCWKPADGLMSDNVFRVADNTPRKYLESAVVSVMANSTVQYSA